MFGKTFDEISLDDLQTMVASGVSEGRNLEFKRDHYGRNDKAKREFAADVSAMANAIGGYLIIGIEETNGSASKIVGIEVSDPDSFVRAVAESIRTSVEPQILGIWVRWISIEKTQGVLLIRIEKSWNAPHRVTVAGDNSFFLRDENGKHPMSVSELRQSFIFATTLEERVRRFRMERLQLLSLNEGPLAVKDSGPRIIFHLMPQAALINNIQLTFDYNSSGIPPLGASGYNSMRSLDGLVTYSGPEESFESVRAFSTLFRNGTVEAVAQSYVSEINGRPSILLAGIEQQLISNVKQSIVELKKYSIPAPYYMMLSIIGVRGLFAPMQAWHASLAYPHRADKILLPELMVDDSMVDQKPSHFLRALFDLMWNAFGQAGSPSYNTEGEYNPRY